MIYAHILETFQWFPGMALVFSNHDLYQQATMLRSAHVAQDYGGTITTKVTYIRVSLLNKKGRI